MQKKRLWIISLNLVFLIFLLTFSTMQGQENKPQTLNQSVLQSKNHILIGTKKGLYFWNFSDAPKLIWKQGSVKQILKTPQGIYLLSSKGIVFSADLNRFELRNRGLKYKTIKHFENNKKTFHQELQDLKDLSVDPFSPNNLITCTKDGVFYTLNQGKSWKFLRNPTTTSGIKAVAMYSRPRLTLLLAHPFKGIYKKTFNRRKWKKMSKGLYRYSGVYEEVSDLVVQKTGPKSVEIVATQNFKPQAYRYNSKKKKWEQIFRLKKKFGILEGVQMDGRNLIFTSEDGIMEYEASQKSLSKINLEKILKQFKNSTQDTPLSLILHRDGQDSYKLHSLWLLAKGAQSNYKKKADQKKGIYLQAHVVRNKRRLKKSLKLMKKTGLNMIVLDMKDDFGKLRFRPRTPLLKKVGEVKNPVPIDSFLAKMKKENIYTVARLVVFKDKVLYKYNNYKYAVKDRSTGRAWRGLKPSGRSYYHEHWVDPYSEKVWEYNIKIAQELLARGFDEIQFDYIRFPTDGLNLRNARFTYRDKGMDKESALISFLKYARENIHGPISIDIYGANGWHRTGARTGQEVEMLQKYVDVICPMYYPSHFAQKFLYYPPYEERTYRIYYYGSLRNYYIAYKNSVIRPYLQAFKWRMKWYDVRYYGPQYIKNQVKGVDDSINMGYTFWNSGSKYSILLKSSLKTLKNIGARKSLEQ